MADDDPRWFERPPPGPRPRPRRRGAVEQLWERCPDCREVLFRDELERTARVCPHCGAHLRITARERIALLVDPGSFSAADGDVVGGDPLGFVDQVPYPERLARARKATGESEAYVAGPARIDGVDVEIGAFDFRFLGGSMGAAVGERIVRQVDRAAERGAALVIVAASGGARMQEGVLSLAQMARTVAAIERFRRVARAPFLSVLTHPTTGGVAASFALLGDVVVSEPRALVGFAGPRVIRETIGEELPEGFQTAEYLLEHGLVDLVAPRGELREVLARLLHLLTDPTC